ncbi:hypothetical protein V6N13_023573 [Hibiscus sabdariffa]
MVDGKWKETYIRSFCHFCNGVSSVRNVALHESHGTAFGVLRKGRIMPSGPSHRGNALTIYTGHLLSKVDTLS